MPLIEMEPQPNALDYPDTITIIRNFMPRETADQLLYEPPEKVEMPCKSFLRSWMTRLKLSKSS